MSDNIVHWDDVEAYHSSAGDIEADWFDLGSASGSDRVGLSRIRIEPGHRSTPAHVHGAEEEIFYVLDGWGLLWQDGAACEVRAGDAVVHLPGSETHTLRAGPHGLDVLAFGTRVPVELCYLPRAGHAWAGPTVVEAPGLRNLFKLDDAAGVFEFGPAGPRPANVVALGDVEGGDSRRGRVRRDLGAAAGSRHTGLKHITAPPGVLTCVPHCHSMEEELFVVLEGGGVCSLGDETVAVRPGNVVARPPGTAVAHSFTAGVDGIALLAYGTREPGDICFYPRSGKIAISGLGVIGRIEPLDYWDGEEL